MKLTYVLTLLFCLSSSACLQQTETTIEVPTRAELVFEVEFKDAVQQQDFEQRLTEVAKGLGEVSKKEFSSTVNQEKIEVTKGKYTIEVPAASIEKAVEIKHKLGIEPSSMHVYISGKK